MSSTAYEILSGNLNSVYQYQHRDLREQLRRRDTTYYPHEAKLGICATPTRQAAQPASLPET